MQAVCRVDEHAAHRRADHARVDVGRVRRGELGGPLGGNHTAGASQPGNICAASEFRPPNSLDLLRQVAALLSAAGFAPVNVDATIIAEAPKILPHAEFMRQRIGDAIGLSMNDISVKATTNEGMGFVGREEGIAALAIASITSRASNHGQ